MSHCFPEGGAIPSELLLSGESQFLQAYSNTSRRKEPLICISTPQTILVQAIDYHSVSSNVVVGRDKNIKISDFVAQFNVKLNFEHRVAPETCRNARRGAYMGLNEIK